MLRRKLPRELEVDADDDARVLRVRRGSVGAVLDFARRNVEIKEFQPAERI